MASLVALAVPSTAAVCAFTTVTIGLALIHHSGENYGSWENYKFGDIEEKLIEYTETVVEINSERRK
jgi:hypothetical protein